MFDKAEFTKGVVSWKQLPRDGRPEIAFVGRSNVGKSSMLNAVMSRKKLAYVSKRPGKTTEFNFFLIDGKYYFVDLPGYGYARVSKSMREKWANLIEQYLDERQTLRAVVHLIDSRHPPMEQDEDLIDFMRGSDVPYLIALTKADKLSGNERFKTVQRLEKRLEEVGRSVPIILTSSKSGRGIKEMRGWLRDFLG
ncbi:GTP-binding protein [Longibacter salinarum]|uniref:Probable GTP-binding protein EngB n=1 Tax=Longibacter salinarum TaxID=1850348 RepID=A0A2A8CXQ0_9BACT|nr:ribosome biogenesis GTP-binding protein YihA/YsxC [Longibacter salinarum]PEN13364.1 GTP-binding protein [Longibacter salinarum]